MKWYLRSNIDDQKEEFEDTKGVIGIRESKNNRQHNGQNKKDKMTNNDLQNIHIHTKKDTRFDFQYSI